ncbi:hypothetical protein AcV7_001643 [Taiwanofungus camphoratus]|nr:hypothetical protein AcV7_001643 [Antrodia cinnamomea]
MGVSIVAFWFTALIVIVPTFYYIRERQRQCPDALYRPQLTLLLLFHTLYIIYILLAFWPPNIFRLFQIPLTAPPESIRAIILQRAGLHANTALPKPLDTLLTRLASFEVRTLYVRFGQAAIQDCEHCRTFDDYALFVLSHTALEYLREAVLLGFLTIGGSGRERWRMYVVGALVGAMCTEQYLVSTIAVHVPTDGTNVFMWHDNLWLLRQLLFLFLPILTHFLPPSRSETMLAVPALASARGALEQSVARLASLRYAHGAVMRDPTLRAAAGNWWERQRKEGVWAREDENVRQVAERLGRGFDEADPGEGRREGKLRTFARMAVERLKAGLAPTVQ